MFYAALNLPAPNQRRPALPLLQPSYSTVLFVFFPVGDGSPDYAGCLQRGEAELHVSVESSLFLGRTLTQFARQETRLVTFSSLKAGAFLYVDQSARPASRALL